MFIELFHLLLKLLKLLKLLAFHSTQIYTVADMPITY